MSCQVAKIMSYMLTYGTKSFAGVKHIITFIHYCVTQLPCTTAVFPLFSCKMNWDNMPMWEHRRMMWGKRRNEKMEKIYKDHRKIFPAIEDISVERKNALWVNISTTCQTVSHIYQRIQDKCEISLSLDGYSFTNSQLRSSFILQNSEFTRWGYCFPFFASWSTILSGEVEE